MDTKAKEEEVPQGEVFESLDEIMGVDSAEYKTIKAWGGRPARIGSLTAGQMITFLENNDKPELRRRNGLLLITLSLVTKNGTRMVNAEDEEAINASIKQLRNKDSKTNGLIVTAILKLNGMNQKDAEAVAKNVSSEAAAGASPTS